MISYQAALNILRSHALSLPTFQVALHEVFHQISAQDITARHALPGFKNSAMDGFAIISAETEDASEKNPKKFRVLGSLPAGRATASLENQENGTVHEIMTGAFVPEPYDAVVPVENVETVLNTEGGVDSIVLREPISSKKNIRYAGEDFVVGDIILKKGEKLTPERIMALAALGVDRVQIFRPVTVAILSTGNEVVDDLRQALELGQIYNSNLPFLATALQNFPVRIRIFKLPRDDREQFHLLMNVIEKENPDCIISMGAVSKGRWDFIPKGLEERGAEIFFHGVAIKPGKPILFAKIKQSLFFGLPGNPVSTAVGFRFFVVPFLRKTFCMPDEASIPAISTHSVNKKSDMAYFLKAKAHVDKNGLFCVEVLSGQESFKIKPLLEANGWVCLESDRSQNEAQKTVSFFNSLT